MPFVDESLRSRIEREGELSIDAAVRIATGDRGRSGTCAHPRRRASRHQAGELLRWPCAVLTDWNGDGGEWLGQGTSQGPDFGSVPPAYMSPEQAEAQSITAPTRTQRPGPRDVGRLAPLRGAHHHRPALAEPFLQKQRRPSAKCGVRYHFIERSCARWPRNPMTGSRTAKELRHGAAGVPALDMRKRPPSRPARARRSPRFRRC